MLIDIYFNHQKYIIERNYVSALVFTIEGYFSKKGMHAILYSGLFSLGANFPEFHE